MTAKLKDSVKNLTRANASLHEALAANPRTRVILSAIIKNFEFNYDLSWKALKRYLEYQGVPTTSPRQAIAEAYRKGYIGDEAVWLKMIQDRNLTVHTYDETFAKDMVKRIEDSFVSVFDRLLGFLSTEVTKL